MSNLQRILILGTGPASIQLAVALKDHLNCCIGIAGDNRFVQHRFFQPLKRAINVFRSAFKMRNISRSQVSVSLIMCSRDMTPPRGNGIHSFWL